MMINLTLHLFGTKLSQLIQKYIFWRWLSFKSNQTAYIWLAPFDLGIVSIWINYILGCNTPPGSVPSDYNPEEEQEEEEEEEDEKDHEQHAEKVGKESTAKPVVKVKELKKSTGKARFCKKCKVYKPPRAHHCSECNKCVLKMDHHCPWLNTCVGHRNLGHFYRFIVSVSEYTDIMHICGLNFGIEAVCCQNGPCR
jgi:palmitoyltransferase